MAALRGGSENLLRHPTCGFRSRPLSAASRQPSAVQRARGKRRGHAGHDAPREDGESGTTPLAVCSSVFQNGMSS